MGTMVKMVIVIWRWRQCWWVIVVAMVKIVVYDRNGRQWCSEIKARVIIESRCINYRVLNNSYVGVRANGGLNYISC